MRHSYIWEVRLPYSRRTGWMGASMDDDRTVRRLVLPAASTRRAERGLGGRAAAGEVSLSRPPYLADALDRYFVEGTLIMPLEASPDYGTPFQKRVWDEVGLIPPGSVRTYGSLAAGVGSVGGARAVGRAVGANPLPIIVP